MYVCVRITIDIQFRKSSVQLFSVPQIIEALNQGFEFPKISHRFWWLILWRMTTVGKCKRLKKHLNIKGGNFWQIHCKYFCSKIHYMPVMCVSRGYHRCSFYIRSWYTTDRGLQIGVLWQKYYRYVVKLTIVCRRRGQNSNPVPPWTYYC